MGGVHVAARSSSEQPLLTAASYCLLQYESTNSDMESARDISADGVDYSHGTM